jgi:hypothetical protein
MTGFLYHTPAKIIQQLIIDQGLGNEPGYDYDWPVFVKKLAEEADESICVYDSEGTLQGRTQFDGVYQEFHGIQVAVRSNTIPDGRLKCHRIARMFDTTVKRTNVTVGSNLYLVHSFNRSTDVVDAGFDKDTARYLHTVNGTASITVTGTGTLS